MTNIQLFNASSIVRYFHDCEDVTISWFVNKRKMPSLSGEILSADNKTIGNRWQTTVYANECFTEPEAKVLFGYLKERHGATEADFKIIPAQLPIPCNVFPLSLMETCRGADVDRYCLWKEPGYGLPFEVGGIYDMRFSKRLLGALVRDNSMDGDIPF